MSRKLLTAGILMTLVSAPAVLAGGPYSLNTYLPASGPQFSLKGELVSDPIYWNQSSSGGGNSSLYSPVGTPRGEAVDTKLKVDWADADAKQVKRVTFVDFPGGRKIGRGWVADFRRGELHAFTLCDNLQWHPQSCLTADAEICGRVRRIGGNSSELDTVANRCLNPKHADEDGQCARLRSMLAFDAHSTSAHEETLGRASMLSLFVSKDKPGSQLQAAALKISGLLNPFWRESADTLGKGKGRTLFFESVAPLAAICEKLRIQVPRIPPPEAPDSGGSSTGAKSADY